MEFGFEVEAGKISKGRCVEPNPFNEFGIKAPRVQDIKGTKYQGSRREKVCERFWFRLLLLIVVIPEFIFGFNVYSG